MAYIVRVSDNKYGADGSSPYSMNFEFIDKHKEEAFAFVKNMADRHQKCVCIFHRNDAEGEMIHRASEAIFNGKKEE